ncbi:MAG: glycosyltransferase [Candidatus Cloacimonetes bacterium]|nr:glycosyltransferase [Candidatus Cloacimonadota bacterium]
MIILILILSVLLLYYLIYLGIFYRGMGRKYTAAMNAKPFVSVVVAARNEESTIPQLLTSLINQDYPEDKYEIIIADDGSDDNTARIVKDFQKKSDNLILLPVTVSDEVISRKKKALAQAVQKSRGEIILTTDADCVLTYQWISGMVRYFGRGVGMVAGLSTPFIPKWKDATLFQKYEYIDTIGLFFAAAGALGVDKAFSCSGQNLGFTREAFNKVQGYETIKRHISGDDVLLMQLIQNAGFEIRFAFGKETHALTKSETRLGNFLNQRTRWASNERSQISLNIDFYIYLADVFLLNVLIIVGFFFIPLYAASAWLLKAIGEYVILQKGIKRFDLNKKSLSVFPLWAILQPLYITIVGIGGKLHLFSWNKKSRTDS